MMEEAAKGGHLDVLKWALSKGCPCGDPDLCARLRAIFVRMKESGKKEEVAVYEWSTRHGPWRQ